MFNATNLENQSLGSNQLWFGQIVCALLSPLKRCNNGFDTRPSLDLLSRFYVSIPMADLDF